jgi:hypothetical protein
VTSDGSHITLMMPKIGRKTLGLKDGSFSHIEIKGGDFRFVGEGLNDEDVVLPVSLLGTYHGNILNNLFLYVANNRHNGFLGVTTGPLTKGVFFKEGHIVFSGSTDATERVGDILMRLGYVTAEQVKAAERTADKRRLGVRLRSMGALTHDELWDGLRQHVMEICASLVDFPVGTFFFLPNCVPEDSFSRFMIEPAEALFQGAIAADERNRGRVAHEDERSLFEALDAIEAGED